MIKLVTVRLGLAGKLVDCDAGLLNVSLGDVCIVGEDRGQHYAEVVDRPQIKESACGLSPYPKILRLVTDEDKAHIQRNRDKIAEKKELSYQKIKKSGLKMRVVDMEYVFDRSKIVCYFTAEGRVDFRRLVVELARFFCLRIELRQIGVRDHARLIGGLGGCGRKLCCSSHLRIFHKVSMQMAKEQDLAVVPSKVSGVCGRLMCCLAYEYDQYKNLQKNMYAKGTVLELKQGKASVVEAQVLKQKLKVELWDSGEEAVCDLTDIKRVIETPKRKKKVQKECYAKI